MRKGLKNGAVVLAMLAFMVGAFSTGTAAYRLARGNDRSRSIAFYGSVLRIAGRSPLAVQSGSSLTKQTDLRPLDTFSNVERRLRANYFEKIEDSSVLAFGTADNMLDSLDDPYSRFLEPDQLKAYAERQEGTYAGIGVILAARKKPTTPPKDKGEGAQPPSAEDRDAMPSYNDPIDINSFRYDVYIATIIPGGPAQAAGLRAGDVLRKVNGKLVFARNLDSLEQILLVPREGSVKLSVTRTGTAKPIDFTVPFRVTQIQPVSTRIDDGVGIISLRSLGAGTSEAVRAKIKEMLAAQVRGIVLDLRCNEEGDFDEASALASTLIPDGAVAKYKERDGKFTTVPAVSDNSVGKLPRLAAVVDETTAGPAELVAAALKARGAGKLFGATTLGHGSRQDLFRTPGASGILLTTKLFYAPLPADAGAVEGTGVTPDVTVTAGGSTQDLSLQRALTWIRNGAA